MKPSRPLAPLVATWAMALMTVVPALAEPGLVDDTVSVAEAEGIPAAPASTRVVRDGEASSVPDPVSAGANAREIKVRPGINKIIQVAIDHINRIVTPFSAVDVQTADPNDFKVKDGVIYLAPTTIQPITYFLTESGDQTRAISLTLVPQHIPPVQINLVFEEGGGGAGFAIGPRPAPSSAPASGLVQPYIDELRDLLRGLALGEIPAGYQMSGIDGRYPFCKAEQGFTVDFSQGQYFSGGRFEAAVGVVRRVAGAPAREFSEVWCGQSPGVAAVALWPSLVLSGGQEAEIYVVKRIGEVSVLPERPRTARPSLIGGGP